MKAKQKLIVFGAGGHAKVVIDLVERQREYDIAGLAEDNPARKGSSFFGYPILGTRADLRALLAPGLHHAIVAVGDNAARAAIAAELAQQGWSFASAVHPQACVGRGVNLGPGCVVMAGCVINADARLGAHVIVNTAATVDHDCRIGDAVHLAPGCHLCGGVSVGAHSLLGVGSSVTPGVKIGSAVLVAAGATVIRDVADGAKISASPAKAID